jgi:inorganic pyrophosphatase
MALVSARIKSGAITFLRQEYLYLGIFCAVFAVLVYFTAETDWLPFTTVAFLIGASTSMACGYIGMLSAVDTNWRVTYACNMDIDTGFHIAFDGGQVLGFALVGVTLLVLNSLISVYEVL